MGKEPRFRAVKGARDILPDEAGRWQHVEEIFRGVFALYGYEEIRVPIFEETALFARGLGDTTDIVEKEMYSFPDKSGHLLSLRPEGTAPVVRAYLENRLDAVQPPVKLYYQGPMFRYERPQKGRQRQFHQIGAELFGASSPEADAELLELLMGALAQLGVAQPVLQVNSLGDGACRPAFRQALLDHFRPRRERLCENCQRRLETNPLRILDCKASSCREERRDAPDIRNFLCDPCRSHFEAVLGLLDEWGVTYQVNPAMVRGLDYYTRTTFEVTSGALGAQDAVAAGGRYDGLVEEFGGPPTPGIGFAVGMERLVSLLPPEGGASRLVRPVFLASLGEKARRESFLWLSRLRRRGVPAEASYEDRSLKSQMRRADRIRAKLVVIAGDDELSGGKVQLRDMDDKTQQLVDISAMVDVVAGQYQR